MGNWSNKYMDMYDYFQAGDDQDGVNPTFTLFVVNPDEPKKRVAFQPPNDFANRCVNVQFLAFVWIFVEFCFSSKGWFTFTLKNVYERSANPYSLM